MIDLVSVQFGIRLVKLGDFENQSFAGVIHAVEFDFGAFAAKFQHYTVQCIEDKSQK